MAGTVPLLTNAQQQHDSSSRPINRSPAASLPARLTFMRTFMKPTCTDHSCSRKSYFRSPTREGGHSELVSFHSCQDEGIRQNKVARVLALAHYQLAGPLRYNFVYNYLDPHVAQLVEFGATRTLKFRCRVVILVFAGCILPWVYSNFVVNDGCKEVEVYISKNTTRMVNTTSTPSEYDMIDAHCSTQRFLQSAWSLLLGPCVLSVAMVCETFLHRRIMLLLYPVLDIITPQIWQLKYHQEPFIYAWVSQAFALLLIEMAVIGLCMRSLVTLVVGYAVGRMLLFAASIVLAPEPGCISILESELRSWGGDPGLQDFFLRLRDHRGAVFAVSEDELHALEKALKGDGRFKKLNKDAADGKLSFVKAGKVERRDVHFKWLYLKEIYVIRSFGGLGLIKIGD